MITAEWLIEFEEKVRVEFEAGNVKGPCHFAGGNESQLIEIFKDIRREDWVMSTWRSHYHALLHGLPPEWVYAEILAGRSLSLNSAAHRFYTSAIVGGTLPIAVGVAAGIKRRGGAERVWVFCGDMAASIGAFMDAYKYSEFNDLPIEFIVENNEMSTNTPTREAWGTDAKSFQPPKKLEYFYARTVPHYGSGRTRHL